MIVMDNNHEPGPEDFLAAVLYFTFALILAIGLTIGYLLAS